MRQDMLNFKETVSVTIILFSIIDIIGSIPVILALKVRSGTIQSGRATIVAGIIMFAIAIKLIKTNLFLT